MKFRSFFILIFSFIFIGFFNFAVASSPFDITFPIPELANCVDQIACKVYCDDLANKDACIAFAQKHGFVSQAEAQKIKNLPTAGPGGCQSEEACRAYCANSNNQDECLKFAEAHGLGKQVRERAKLIRETGGPGQCQSEGECRAYCENPANQNECLDFAEKHGLVDKEKAKFFRKVVKEGGPGNCRGEAECRAYCDNPDNFKECVEFAEDNGFISKEEAQRIKKLPPVGPGGCRGQECQNYCENPEHQEECLKFAEEHDLLPKEEIERARKFVNKSGPGGCRGQECRDYCENPNHQEECFNFAVENNLIPKEESERARKFIRVSREGGPGGCRGQECRNYCGKEENREACFEFAKKQGLIAPEELRRAEAGQNLSKKVKEIGGPGGCKSDEECRNYCSDPNNVEECAAFAVAQGGFSKEEAKKMLEEFIKSGGRPHEEFRSFEDEQRFKEERFRRFDEFQQLERQFRTGPLPATGFPAGPGGCQGPEECIKYCSDPAHRDECAKFNPAAGGPPPGEIFRQIEPGTESQYQQKTEDLNQCGPRPLYPVKYPCTGPVCKDGQWRVICPEGANLQGTPPPSTGEFSQPTNGVLCTQEYAPVCGADNQTYPNGCYAKIKGVSIAYPGQCKTDSELQKYPYPYQSPTLYPQYSPIQSPYPADQYKYPAPYLSPSPLISPFPSPASETQPTGSRVSRFLGNLIQGLLNIFK